MIHWRRTACWLIPVLVYVAALALAPRTMGRDLRPAPDAMEYALLAERLARFEPPLIGLGFNDYPSRYSLAYPILLAPWFWLLGGDPTRLHWIASAFGLISVLLMVWNGRWMLGSLKAAMIGAVFWALHPAILYFATLNMSEMGLTMMFLWMLAVARPWLDPTKSSTRGHSTRRACLLGLIYGWLVIAKPFFIFWPVWHLVSFGLGARSRRSSWRPLCALAGTFGATILADLIYRRWAFGEWGMNGYRYWVPDIYEHWSRVFNWRYLWSPWDPNIAFAAGNLWTYGRQLLGQGLEFYSPCIPALVAIAVIAYLRQCKKKNQAPAFRIVATFGLWLIAGGFFCAFYFFQSSRFLLIWMPVIDMCAAWGFLCLVRSGPRRWSKWALSLGVLAAFIVLQLPRLEGGFYRAVAGSNPTGWTSSLRTVLSDIPEEAWVWTNLDPPLVEMNRLGRRPVGALDARLSDHMTRIEDQGLLPHGPRAGSEAIQTELPFLSTQPTLLIDRRGEWRFPETARRRLWQQPTYFVIAEVDPTTGAPLDLDPIERQLRQELNIELLKVENDLRLYRASQDGK